MIRRIIPLLALLLAFQLHAQEEPEKPIKVVDERVANRVRLYALNETLTDYDVLITVEGRNFRQSKGRPRLIRVPGASKVHLKDLIVERGKMPQYTVDLEINDSLSRRALRKEATGIKIDPKKRIIIYMPDNCVNCDSIIDPLEKSVWRYKSYVLSEHPKLKEGLSKAFVGASKPLDSIDTFIVSLGGALYVRMKTYEELLEELDKEE